MENRKLERLAGHSRHTLKHLLDLSAHLSIELVKCTDPDGDAIELLNEVVRDKSLHQKWGSKDRVAEAICLVLTTSGHLQESGLRREDALTDGQFLYWACQHAPRFVMNNPELLHLIRDYELYGHYGEDFWDVLKYNLEEQEIQFSGTYGDWYRRQHEGKPECWQTEWGKLNTASYASEAATLFGDYESVLQAGIIDWAKRLDLKPGMTAILHPSEHHTENTYFGETMIITCKIIGLEAQEVNRRMEVSVLVENTDDGEVSAFGLLDFRFPHKVLGEIGERIEGHDFARAREWNPEEKVWVADGFQVLPAILPYRPVNPGGPRQVYLHRNNTWAMVQSGDFNFFTATGKE